MLADRLYGTYWNVAWALANGMDVVFRSSASRAPVSFRGYAADTRRVVWQWPARPKWMSRKEYKRIPSSLVLRAVRVQVHRAGFRTRRLVLITTLTDAQDVTGADSGGPLSVCRWQAEVISHAFAQADFAKMDYPAGPQPGRSFARRFVGAPAHL